jgi:hypothetical protein
VITVRETPVVVLMGPALHPALTALMERRRWPRLAGATAPEVLRQLPRDPRPPVVVVHSGGDAGEAASLTSRLRGPWWRSPVVLVYLEPADEPRLRAAGPVACFGPGAPQESIEAAVEDCLASVRPGHPAHPHAVAPTSGAAHRRTTAF